VTIDLRSLGHLTARPIHPTIAERERRLDHRTGYEMTAPHDDSSLDAAEPPTMAPDPKPGRSGLGWVVEIVETVVLTFVIFLVIQNFIGQPFKVDGQSMEDTFLDGQYVLVDRISHTWSPYERGQVVVFQPPSDVEDSNYPFIKRVIGVGGDVIELRNGKVYVNGTALDEPYLFRGDTGQIQPTEPLTVQTRWTVPQGDLFVMGDHREVSEDSRAFGPIPVSSVIGRALIRYWPLSDFEMIATPSYAP
jgi:signal peptidase I